MGSLHYVVEDLSQDLLVTIWERLDRYEGRGPFDSWIYGFCFRGYLARLRRRRPVPLEQEVETPEETLTDSERLELLLEERIGGLSALFGPG